MLLSPVNFFNVTPPAYNEHKMCKKVQSKSTFFEKTQWRSLKRFISFFKSKTEHYILRKWFFIFPCILAYCAESEGSSSPTIPSEKWAYETYLLYLLEEGSRDVMMSLPKEERFWKVFLLLHRNSAFVFMRDQKDQIIWNSISIKTLMILSSKNSLMAKDQKLILFFPWKNILTYKKIEWT